jgi:putative sigma-54 modulation protein
MNITITFRQMPASAALTKHVQEKAAKLQKFLRQPMSAKVTLSLDRLKHVAEARISSGGQHLEAKETNDDMYASVDKVIDKLERQIRGMKGTKQSKTRRGGATLRGGSSVPPAEGTDGASAEQLATTQPRTVKVALKTQPDKSSRPKLPVNRSRTMTKRSQAR